MNIISFPRSGQHLTESILRKILSAHNIEFSYCEFYTCCKSTPCAKGKIFQKNHDFSGKLEIKCDQKYIVLYRADPILQLEAYYRYSCLEAYSKEELLKFYNNKIKYYTTFKNKWTSTKYENVLPIEYYDLCNNTYDIVIKILNFYYPHIQFDESLIKSLISEKFEIYNKGSKIVQPIKILHTMNDEVYQYIKLNRTKL